MNRLRWYPVGPHKREAYHGPFLARMRPEDSVWFVMAIFRGGVWLHTQHATRAKLKRAFVEECERYELECDRARLDWLDSQRNFMVRRAWWSESKTDVEVSTSTENEVYGADVRAAIDAAMPCNRSTLDAQATEQKGADKHVVVWEATGIPSGDHDGFCLAVTAEEYERAEGELPDEQDANRHHAGLFNLYPLNGKGGRGRKVGLVRYRVEIEDLD